MYQSRVTYLGLFRIPSKLKLLGSYVSPWWKQITFSALTKVSKTASNRKTPFILFIIYKNCQIQICFKQYYIQTYQTVHMAVKSQLQKQILAFSREVWKYVYNLKEPARTQLGFYVRSQFNQHKTIPRIKFFQIQYRLRQGKNRFKIIKESGAIDGISYK